MEKQTSDKYSSRISNYDKLVLGDPNKLEIIIAGMSNSQLIEFYEYCQDKIEENNDKSDYYWFASSILEETSVVKMYRNGQLYVDATLGNVNETMVVENVLTVEDINQINEIISLINQRKEERHNPIKKFLRVIKRK